MININDTRSEIEQELRIYHKGYDDCPRGYSFGPFIRDHYLIHFIESGTGLFETPEGTFHLKENQGFVIHPNILTYYKADENTPWSYYWIGFHGLDAELILKNGGITKEFPVIDFSNQSDVMIRMKEIYELEDKELGKTLKSKGLLYLLLDSILSLNINETNNYSGNNLKLKYTEMAISYIKRNYSMECKIEDMAKYLNIERSHLSRIFSSTTGLSPKEYLIRFRIEKAKDLLTKTDLTINTIGCSVGYFDPYHFSKIFKKTTGYTPSQFSRMHK